MWRIIVPVLSGVLAVFVAFMVSSGLVPFINARVFDNFYVALSVGFFFGHFSDNILASLQKTANRVFGTVDR